MLKKIAEFAEKIFFPWDVSCINCDSEVTYKYGLCKDCFITLKPIDGNRCAVCGDIIPSPKRLCDSCAKKRPCYETLFVPYVFSGELRGLIHNFKFKNCRYLRHPFGKMIFDALPDNISELCDIIVPVPASPKRQRKRGYNQAAELAKEISAYTGLTVNTGVLKKREGQKQMALLNKAQRRQNIEGFYYTASQIDGKRVLLVDDICTTGETLRICAEELKKAGASNVLAACLARTDLHGSDSQTPDSSQSGSPSPAQSTPER